jgi:BirA family biotin operon repressor/biotin-[acetyl-CoA-carboxylase] ligase
VDLPPRSSPSPWSDLGRPPLRATPLRRALLGAPGPWTSLDLVPATGSTNDDLAARATAGTALDGAVLTTDHQRAGHGRHDRVWTAPPRSSIAVSVLVVPGSPGSPVPQARWSWLPLLAGVAVAQALTDVAGVQAALKWPNDVLLEVDGDPDGGGKVCGVLAQVVTTPTGPAVVLGLGLNVSQRADELPVPTAASLATAAATTTDRDTVLRAVLRTLGTWVQDWRAAAGDPHACGLAPAYRSASSTIGRQVGVHLPGDEVLLGAAVDVDDDGRLVVAPADGSPARALAAGDVVHVR